MRPSWRETPFELSVEAVPNPGAAIFHFGGMLQFDKNVVYSVALPTNLEELRVAVNKATNLLSSNELQYESSLEGRRSVGVEFDSSKMYFSVDLFDVTNTQGVVPRD